MDHCMVCLRLNNNSRIYKDSKEWYSKNVQKIIEKHLWWWWYSEPGNQNLIPCVCQGCWEQLKSFHQFFLMVKTQHRILMADFKKQEKAESETSKANLDCLKPATEITIGKTMINLMNEIKQEEETEIMQSNEIELEETQIMHSNEIEVDETQIMQCDEIQLEEAQVNQSNEFEVEETQVIQSNEVSVMYVTEVGNEIETVCVQQQTDDSSDDDNDWKVILDEFSIEECSNEADNSTVVTTIIEYSEATEDATKEKPKIKRPQFIPPAGTEILELPKQELICHLCSKPQTDFIALKKHFQNVHKIRGYAFCCGRKFYERYELLDHLNVHSNPNYFKCTQCQKVLSNRKCYKLHIEGHEPAGKKKQTLNFKCEMCAKAFHLKGQLKDHIARVHFSDENKLHACDQCSRKYATKAHLKQHIDRYHLKKYGCVCDVCGQSLKDKSSYERHMETHLKQPKAAECDNDNGNIITCPICGIKIKSESFAMHTEKKHSAAEMLNRVHKCPHCGKMSATKAGLNSHIHYSHKAKAKHVCDLCEKAFKRVRELDEHMAKHIGQKLYKCSECPLTFTTSRSLYKHRSRKHPKQNVNEKQNNIEPEIDVET